jgi:hypothetical protein
MASLAASAINAGSLPCLKFVVSHGGHVGEFAARHAAHCHSADCLRYLHLLGVPLTPQARPCSTVDFLSTCVLLRDRTP